MIFSFLRGRVWAGTLRLLLPASPSQSPTLLRARHRRYPGDRRSLSAILHYHQLALLPPPHPLSPYPTRRSHVLLHLRTQLRLPRGPRLTHVRALTFPAPHASPPPFLSAAIPPVSSPPLPQLVPNSASSVHSHPSPFHNFPRTLLPLLSTPQLTRLTFFSRLPFLSRLTFLLGVSASPSAIPKLRLMLPARPPTLRTTNAGVAAIDRMENSAGGKSCMDQGVRF
jgi:hypothetical protein